MNNIEPLQFRILTSAVLATAAASAIACSGGDLTLPRDGAPGTIAAVAGQDQRGQVGTALEDALVAQVTDLRDRPLAGVTVTFAFEAAAAGGELAPVAAETDADGRAGTQALLGPKAGRQAVTASVSSDGAAPISATFTATAAAGAPRRLSAVGGGDQAAPAGATLPQPLVVRVADEFDNPIEGVAVDWTITGGGNVSAASVESGVDGRASVRRTLGALSGDQTTRARARGVATAVTFSHSARASGNGGGGNGGGGGGGGGNNGGGSGSGGGNGGGGNDGGDDDDEDGDDDEDDD